MTQTHFSSPLVSLEIWTQPLSYLYPRSKFFTGLGPTWGPYLELTVLRSDGCWGEVRGSPLLILDQNRSPRELAAETLRFAYRSKANSREPPKAWIRHCPGMSSLLLGGDRNHENTIEASCPRTQGYSHMKMMGMLVVSLRGVNHGFWIHLGCSGRNNNMF